MLGADSNVNVISHFYLSHSPPIDGSVCHHIPPRDIHSLVNHSITTLCALVCIIYSGVILKLNYWQDFQVWLNKEVSKSFPPKASIKLDEIKAATVWVFWKLTSGVQQFKKHLCLENFWDSSKNDGGVCDMLVGSFSPCPAQLLLLQETGVCMVWSSEWHSDFWWKWWSWWPASGEGQ